MNSEVLQNCSCIPGVCPGKVVSLVYGTPNDLELYRGNSVAFEVIPVDEAGETIKLGTGDKIIFSISLSPNSPSPTTRRVYSRILTANDYDSEDRLIIELKPHDTMQLQDRTYWYDVAIYFSDGQLYTFIPFSKLVVKPAGSDISILEESEKKP